MKSIRIQNNIEGIKEGLDFIESTLSSFGFKAKYIQEAILLSEETIVKLIDSGNTDLKIKMHKHFNLATIDISSIGNELDEISTIDLKAGLDMSAMRKDAEIIIRDTVLRSYDDKINYKYKKGKNYVKILVGLKIQTSIMNTLACMVLATLIAFICRAFLPLEAIKYIQDYVAYPIEKFFMNALQAIVVPTIFFGIVMAVTKFYDFSETSTMAFRVVIGYLTTSIVAAGIGIFLVSIIKPGEVGLGASLFNFKINNFGVSGDIPILQSLYELIPDNIIQPFIESKTAHLVILALISGIAVGKIGNRNEAIYNFFDSCDMFFKEVANIIESLLPILTFFATYSIVLVTGRKTFISLFEYVITLIIGMLFMTTIYVLIVLFRARISPRIFIRKIAPIFRNLFKLGNSGDMISYIIRELKYKMGVSRKVSSLIIPIGNVLNMDANCLNLSVCGLFLARFYGIQVFGSTTISIIASVVLLSVGCPNVLGSNILSMILLVTQLGMTPESIVIIVGIDAMLSMFLTVNNTLGDIVETLVVASDTNMIDIDVLKS